MAERRLQQKRQPPASTNRFFPPRLLTGPSMSAKCRKTKSTQEGLDDENLVAASLKKWKRNNGQLRLALVIRRARVYFAVSNSET